MGEFYSVLLAPGSASGLDIVLWNSCIILNQVCSSVSALVMPDVAPAVKGDRSLCCWIPGSASGLLATLLEGSGLCNSSSGFFPHYWKGRVPAIFPGEDLVKELGIAGFLDSLRQ